MKQTFLFIALSVILTCGASNIRGQSLKNNDNADHHVSHRELVQLGCNDILASVDCVTWTSFFGPSVSYLTRVEIPCGKCIKMDLPGPTLALNDGINVIGKLVFPDDYSLDILTTTIIVQGELHMYATKPVDGSPSISVTLIGEEEVTFEPTGENEYGCMGVATCEVGKKSIAVAGGKVNIHGLPADTPTWLPLYDVVGTSNTPQTIIVKDSVKGKWAVGADILITSHTLAWNEHQEREITGIRDSSISGYVELVLSSPIIRPTTSVESPDFAVEVALLSRSILFQGGSDTTSRHGGHFWIMYTPTIIQTIEGVELRNFGQQGNLGRYPIHFHMCGNVQGSSISKNSIRHSNQRCVVVHGTNNLLIDQNVAYDTKGHCYILEDGIETGNTFSKNLGAQTGIPETIIPNQGSNGDESDDQPSTFWITNPTNSFNGNVAAGSEDSGFWFEPLLRGPRKSFFEGYGPMYEPLISFKDNVAHSNAGKNGAVRMYTPGYFPRNLAYFDGLKAFRNFASGIFIHRNHNIVVINSLFADNYIGIDVDRAEGIEIRDTTIIGESQSYKALMSRQSDITGVCRFNKVIGIDLHTWKVDKEFSGVSINNITLSGFGKDSSCATAAAISMDDHTLEQGQFELFTSFQKVTLTDGSDAINFCEIDDSGINTVYLVDIDGGLSPSFVTPTSTSVVLSNGPEIQKFVDANKCTVNDLGCYSYCRDTCFRSVRYEIEPDGTENYQLKVCRRGSYDDCATFYQSRRENNNRGGELDPRIFMAHVPSVGVYDAFFVDGSGNEVIPKQVLEEYELSLCPSGQMFEFKLLESGRRAAGIPSNEEPGEITTPTILPNIFLDFFRYLLSMIFRV